MEDNQAYDNIEFVLLDYNSNDGLEDFVKSTLHEPIANGKLKYFRIKTPKHYSMSHSRNLAFRVASGEIVCNIDADNYTEKGFASYINDVFDNKSNVFISTHSKKNIRKDVLGRICVKKQDFLSVNGYDERMLHYGFDDYDFVNRLEIYGLKKHILHEHRFLNAIEHSNKERMNNNLDSDSDSKVLVSHISPDLSELLFMFNNGTFKKGTMVNNYAYNALNVGLLEKCPVKYEYSIMEKYWGSGSWNKVNEDIHLISGDKKKSRFQLNGNDYQLTSENNEKKVTYQSIEKPQLKEEALFFYNQISNRLIMEENLSNNTYLVNKQGYAQGVVFKNFQNSPIKLN